MFKPDATQFLVVLFVIALLVGQGALALLLGLVLLTLGVARLWSRFVLRRITYERVLTPDHAFVGDEVQMLVHVRNAKLLGVPSLRIRDVVSARLPIQNVKLVPHTQPATRLMERWTSLRPYEAVSWHVTIQCVERGYFPFGPAQLEATDPWGLYTVEADLAGRAGLVVYPRLIPLEALALNPRHPLGDLRASQRMLSDPARTVGIRDYRRGDPFKAIHWGATARRGQIQTRVYEPTTSLELAVALDLDTFEHYWEGTQPELAEWMISAAASLATAAGEARWSLGLYANCAAADNDQLIRLPPSRSPAQIALIMETLAKIVPYSIAPMPNMLRRLGPTLPWGATLLLISSVPSEAMQHALLRQAEHGRRVVWVYPGAKAPPTIPGVDIRHVAPVESWRRSGTTWSSTPVERDQVVLHAG